MNDTHREQKLSVGDRITLGRWPQGADGRVEPICWQVLEVREDRALVLSEFVLDARAFHDAEEPTRWKHSALRAWLNGEFLQGAFSEVERTRLFACEPQADPAGDAMWREMNMDDATESLEDKVFLLDSVDVARCFRQDAEGVAYPGLSAEATAYAKRKLADIGDGEKAIWWLRSTLPQWPFAHIVSPVDTVGVSALHADNAQGVRPALWLLPSEPEKGLLS